MRPLSSLRATMRTSPAGRSSGELASQRFTVAVVGKNRTRGSCRSPQVLSGWRCWRPNSTAAAVEFARHDAHGRAVAAAVFLGGGGGGHDGAAQDGEQGDERRAGAAPVTAGPAGGGHVRRGGS